MFTTMNRILAALCLLVATFSHAEGPAPQYRLDAQLYQVDTAAMELLKRALLEHYQAVTDPTRTFQYFVLEESVTIKTDLLTLTVSGPKLSIEVSGDAPKKLCQILMSPCVVALAEEKAGIVMGACDPLQYFKKRKDGLFELNLQAVELGYSLECTIHPSAEGEELSLDFSLSASDVGVRLPVEGVTLDVGQPIATKYETKGNSRTKPGQWTTFFLPNWDEFGLCLFLRASPLAGEMAMPKQFDISQNIWQVRADEQGNLPEAPDAASADFFIWLAQPGALEDKAGQEPGAAIRHWSDFPNLSIPDLRRSLEHVGGELLSAPRVTTMEAGSDPPTWMKMPRGSPIQNTRAFLNLLELYQGTAIEPFLKAPKKGMAIIADVTSSLNPETGKQRLEGGCATSFEVSSGQAPGQIQLAYGLHYLIDDFRWERRGLFRSLKRVPSRKVPCNFSTDSVIENGDGLIVAQRMPDSKDAIVTLIAAREVVPHDGVFIQTDPFSPPYSVEETK